MQNLGTQAGDLIPSGGLIASDPNPSRASVSEYSKYYGTYSGADVKVVVHYPRDPAMEKAIQVVKANIEAEIVAEEAWFWTNEGSLGAKEFADAIERRNILATELQGLNEQLSGIQNMPTSKVLGEITSLSWSLHRDKAPFRPLGSVYPKAYTRGPRTIAGTMVFTVFHEHVFHELSRLGLGYYSTGTSDFDKYEYTTVLADQLPPLDISLIFANEYGAISHMGFWGVEFFQEGGTFSIEDIYSENILHYVARDLDPMRIAETRVIDGQGVSSEWNQTASDMLREKQLIAHLTRRNPFI